jgi:hypothetical protein
MKAITLWQPWASLIADKRKPVETRPRPWHYRGIIAIHAGKHVDREACVRFGYNPDTITRGCVVCLVFKDACVQFPDTRLFVTEWEQTHLRHIVPDEYGNYADGRYGYTLYNPQKFNPPVPAKGSQGIWEWEGVIGIEKRGDLLIPLYSGAPV